MSVGVFSLKNTVYSIIITLHTVQYVYCRGNKVEAAIYDESSKTLLDEHVET